MVEAVGVLVGLLSHGLAKAYENQKNAIFKEASGIGAQVIGFEEFAEGASAGRLLGDALKDKILPFGGKTKVDGLQIYGFETAGVKHLYVQPFGQMMPLPGEHHAWLPGAYRSPIAFERGMIMGMSWNAGGDADLASWLGNQPSLHSVVKQCKKEWKAGVKVFDLEWTVQLTSLGDGRSHLVMQAGRYGGLTSYQVGLRHFMSLGHAMAPLLSANTYPAQSPLHPVAYAHLFYQYVLQAPATQHQQGQPSPAPQSSHAQSYAPQAQETDAMYRAPAAPTGPDHTDLIRQLAGPHKSETLFVGAYPPEVEANVRALVLPIHAQQSPIALIHDLTVMGSGKDAVVLTPNYLYVREIGDTWGFSFDDLLSVDPPKGMLVKSVKVQLKSGRAVKVPCANGPDAKAMQAVLSGIAASLNR